MAVTWTYTSAGSLVWGLTCLVGALCVILLHSKPSNGIWLVYLQYLAAHVVFTPIVLINTMVVEDALANRILSMFQDAILAFAAGCYFRLASVIWFKYQSQVHTVIRTVVWTSVLLIWVAIVVLHFALKMPLISTYIYASYYTVAALLAYAAIIRELVAAMCGWNSPAYAEGTNARSPFAGCSRLIFALFGFFGATWGMIDWLLVIFDAFGVAMWEPQFLSRVFDSVFYVPLACLFILWWDCPVNVKVHRQGAGQGHRDTVAL